jgi:hypothetical protein
VEHDYSREVREISRELILYLRDMRSNGYKTLVKKRQISGK